MFEDEVVASLENEGMYLETKVQVKWLRVGDRNTSFFTQRWQSDEEGILSIVYLERRFLILWPTFYKEG